MEVQPEVQMVEAMFACVTLGLIAPGVRDELGSMAPAELITAPPPIGAGFEGPGEMVLGDGGLDGALRTGGAVVGLLCTGGAVEGGRAVLGAVARLGVLLVGGVARR